MYTYCCKARPDKAKAEEGSSQQAPNTSKLVQLFRLFRDPFAFSKRFDLRHQSELCSTQLSELFHDAYKVGSKYARHKVPMHYAAVYKALFIRSDILTVLRLLLADAAQPNLVLR